MKYVLITLVAFVSMNVFWGFVLGTLLYITSDHSYWQNVVGGIVVFTIIDSIVVNIGSIYKEVKEQF